MPSIYPAYNLNMSGNATGIVDLMQIVNKDLMFNKFGILLLLTIFLITLFAFLISTGGNASKSFAASSFIAFSLSMLLIILELIPNYVIYITIFAMAVSIVFIRKA